MVDKPGETPKDTHATYREKIKQILYLAEEVIGRGYAPKIMDRIARIKKGIFSIRSRRTDCRGKEADRWLTPVRSLSDAMSPLSSGVELSPCNRPSGQ